MKKSALRLIVLLPALFMVFSMSGCGQILAELPFLGGSQAATQPAVMTESTPIAEPVEVHSPTQVDEKVSEITIWLPPVFDPENGSQEGKILKQQLQAFTNANPEITINVRIKAVSGPSGLLDALNAASLAAPAAVPGFLLLPRTDMENAVQSGLLDPIEIENNPVFNPSYYPFAEELAVVNGTRYGLPFSADALCLAYKSLQVVYPPRLWQEVIQLKKVLAFPAADPQGSMTMLLYMEKGGTFEETETLISVDETALQQTLLFLAEGANGEVLPYWLTEHTTFEESWQALKDSQATYSVIRASQYLTELPENTAITTLPSFDEGSLTLADGWVIVFPKTSAERMAVYQQLAAYLLEVEFQAAWTESAGMLPVSSSVLDAWRNDAVSVILHEIAESARLFPSTRIMSRVSPLLNQATIEMLRKQTTYIESSNKIIKALSE